MLRSFSGEELLCTARCPLLNFIGGDFMIKKIAAASAAVIIVLAVILTVIFSPKAIEIDFDSVVNEMKPVHNIGRMSDYELDSEMNSYFTEANMTSCRTCPTDKRNFLKFFFPCLGIF